MIQNETDDFKDIELVCCQCGREFTWFAGEQKFYLAHNLLKAPRRCERCRFLHRLELIDKGGERHG